MATVYSLVCFGGLSGKTVTFTDAGDVVNLTAHGLRQGVTGIVFSNTGGALPTGITAGTTYYPRDGADANKFTIYPTAADALANTNQITFSGTGSGTNTVKSAYMLGLNSTQLARYGDSGVERIYDGIKSWRDTRFAATLGAYDTEICEIYDAFTETITAGIVLNFACKAITITTMVAGERSPAFHVGNFGAGYFLYSTTQYITLLTASIYNVTFDGFEIFIYAGDSIALGMSQKTIVQNCLLRGRGAAFIGGIGLKFGGYGSAAYRNIIKDFQFGIQTIEYTGTTSVCYNNLTTKNNYGIGNTSRTSIAGWFYNNISVGNTVNWSTPPLNIEGSAYNCGELADKKTITADYTLDTFTLNAHGRVANTPIRLTTSGTLPGVASGAALDSSTVYYCVTVTTNTFKISRTSGGAALDLTDNGTGTHYTTNIWNKEGDEIYLDLSTNSGNDVFVDFANNNFRSAGSAGTPNAAALQVDSGLVVYQGVDRDILGNPCPAYNPDGTDSWDCGPFEFDKGHGLAPVLGGGLDITCESGTQIVVYTTGTTTELSRDDNSDGTFSWQSYTASIVVDFTIQKAGYLPQRYAGITLTSVLAIDANQVVDRAYAVSSGITFGTTGTITVGTKIFGLTAVSTGVNWYSFLIESWIAETSLCNVDFPVLHDGDESFTLLNGWEFSTTNWTYLRRCGIRYLSTAYALMATFSGLLSIGDIGSNTAQIQQSDGGNQVTASATGDIDQLIQVYGDATHGNFDRTGHLVAKAQVNGYLSPAYDIIADGSLSALSDKLYSFPLNLVSSGIATGDPGITGVTITDHAGSPVTWNSKVFSITITDSGTNSGTDIAKWISYNLAQGGTFQSKATFNWHDMVLPNGDGYKTIRGVIYGDTGAAIKGVRVLRGTDPHPDFNIHTADDGTTYSPPEVASVTLTNVTAGSMVQIYDTTSNTQLYLGTGPSYYWNETYSVDRAIRIRVMYQSGVAAKMFLEANIGSITAANPQLTYLVNQVTDNVYVANAIDGSTITGITINDALLLINVNTSSIALADIYAYETYWLSTATGIVDETRIITAVDTANYIFSNFKIKNTGIGPLVITGGYMQDADTGAALDIIDTTGGTIFLAPDHVVPYAAGAEATVAIVQSGLTAQGYTGTRAGKIDTIDTLATRSAFSDKVIKNKRVITAGKELVVYDDDNTTPILQKALKDISGAAIADLATGVLAQEIASSV